MMVDMVVVAAVLEGGVGGSGGFHVRNSSHLQYSRVLINIQVFSRAFFYHCPVHWTFEPDLHKGTSTVV